MNQKKANKIFVTSFYDKTNKTVKPYYDLSLEESVIRDLKPILFICRLFGMAPYQISSKNFSLSNIGVIYSGIFVIYNAYIFLERTKVYYSEEMDQKLKILSIARLMILVTTVCADVILCIFWDRKLQNSLNNTWYYEKVIKFQRKKRNNFVIISSILTITNVVFFLLMGLLSYLFDHAEGLSALIYVTLYLAMSFGLMKFLLIVIIINRRFKNLNSYFAQEFMTSTVLDIDNGIKSCDFLDVWSLHDQLSSAIENLNSLYSVQLLLWIATIAFNIISRIYVFFTTTIVTNFYWNMREILLLLYFSTLLAGLTIICHTAAKEANKLTSIIFSPRCFQRWQQSSKQSSSIIGYYFLNHSFDFKAAFGLFAVNIQLILSIAGSITTYLVILIGYKSASN